MHKCLSAHFNVHHTLHTVRTYSVRTLQYPNSKTKFGILENNVYTQ